MMMMVMMMRVVVVSGGYQIRQNAQLDKGRLTPDIFPNLRRLRPYLHPSPLSCGDNIYMQHDRPFRPLFVTSVSFLARIGG